MSENLSPTAKRLKERMDKAAFRTEQKASRSTVGKVAHELHGLTRFLASVSSVLVWMWWNLGNPFLNMFTVPILKQFVGWYVRTWTKFTTYVDKYGNRKTSKVKGASMVIGTIAAALMSVQMVMFTFDVGLYLLTRHEDERVWLAAAQEIDPGSGIFALQGCEMTIENDAGLSTCSEKNSLYYRVSPTFFNNTWSLLKGHGIFFPDLIVSPIGADWSKCTVTTYGIRMRLLIFLGDVYPTLLSANCERASS